MSEGKICNSCKIYLPYEKFSKASDNADGYQYKCKECCKVFYLTKNKPYNPKIEGEVWVPLIGMEGSYMVSDMGRVKSIERKIKKKDGRHYTAQERVLQYWVNKKGYHVVCVSLNGNNRAMLVHRLVAMTFHENPKKLPEVNHKDGVKSNNNYLNLEWCTSLDNNKHARLMGLIKYISGNNKKVKNIKTGQVFQSIKDASKTIGMHYQSLSNRLHGKTKNETNFILL